MNASSNVTVVYFEARRDYLVRISYTEPTYEYAHGLSPRPPFIATYRYEGVSSKQARTLAEEEFRRTEELSSVGWIRQIVRVEVISM